MQLVFTPNINISLGMMLSFTYVSANQMRIIAPTLKNQFYIFCFVFSVY